VNLAPRPSCTRGLLARNREEEKRDSERGWRRISRGRAKAGRPPTTGGKRPNEASEARISASGTLRDGGLAYNRKKKRSTRKKGDKHRLRGKTAAFRTGSQTRQLGHQPGYQKRECQTKWGGETERTAKKRRRGGAKNWGRGRCLLVQARKILMLEGPERKVP